MTFSHPCFSLLFTLCDLCCSLDVGGSSRTLDRRHTGRRPPSTSTGGGSSNSLLRHPSTKSRTYSTPLTTPSRSTRHPLVWLHCSCRVTHPPSLRKLPRTPPLGVPRYKLRNYLAFHNLTAFSSSQPHQLTVGIFMQVALDQYFNSNIYKPPIFIDK